MAPLSTLVLPLPPHGPPSGYDRSDHALSALSTTTAFYTGLDERDKFLGNRCCVICGDYGSGIIEHCHLIEPETWGNLKDRLWIPSQAKAAPRHEPRDGMLMCKPIMAVSIQMLSSSVSFQTKQIRKFVFINYSGHPNLQQFHGKAIALDIKDKYAPFPSLFIIHEMRVRGFHPFQPVVPTIPDDIPWQDWILLNHVFDNASDFFKRGRPPSNSVSAQAQLPFHPTTTRTDGASSSQRTLALNADVIADILAATRAMPSWKACQIEGTSWTGTAEENIQKYASM